MASDGKLNALVGLSSELADLVEHAAGTVYSIDARRKFPASGFAISENQILTADHVIEREEGLFAGDGKEKFAATLVGRDPHHDLALLSVVGVNMNPLPNSAGDARVGSLAIALARPGRGIQASLGLISSIGSWPSRRESGTVPAILRAEVTPHPGFSGGPLISVQGEVLGLNTSAVAMGGLVTLSMAFIQPLLEQLRTAGHIRHGYLGIRFQVVELDPGRIEGLARPQKTGLLVVNVETGSPAANAKIRVGDIVVGLANVPADSIESLQVMLISDLVGKRVPVELLRGNGKETLEVEIGERRGADSSGWIGKLSTSLTRMGG